MYGNPYRYRKNIAEMLGAPRSKEFDDVYFSAENGLAETRHTFLVGNGLPERWSGVGEFTIAETGFGTGLNFLAAWKLFEETASEGQTLHFISFEKYPLSAAQIEDYLQPWAGEFGGMLKALVEKYAEGEVRINERVKLTLFFADVNEAIVQQTFKADAWFLDGFKPSSNPEMWSETVFKNMERLSNAGASLATFTAAGFVRRGLAEAGFAVEKVRGYGTKRDMTVGRLCG